MAVVSINLSAVDKRDQPFVKQMQETHQRRMVYWRPRKGNKVQISVISNYEPGTEDYGTMERFLMEEGYKAVLG